MNAVIAFNDPGYHNICTTDGQNIFDKYEVQFYNWIVDHPVSQLHYLETSCNNYNILCLDRYHVDFVKSYRPNIRSVSFLPLGGISEQIERVNPIKDRLYDVVFPGGMLNGTLMDALNSYKNLPMPNNEIILNIIDYMMSNQSEDVISALDETLNDLYGSLILDDEENYQKALRLASVANDFMRSYNRETVLRKLLSSDVKLHIFGEGWKERIGLGSNTIFHSPLPYEESVEIFRRAKVVINIMPCFKNGTHDRIASGMLQRAAVMTDRSIFLDEMPNGVVAFYDIEQLDDIPERLKEMLSKPKKLQEIADMGYEYGKENFTWEKTVEKLLGLMRSTE